MVAAIHTTSVLPSAPAFTHRNRPQDKKLRMRPQNISRSRHRQDTAARSVNAPAPLSMNYARQKNSVKLCGIEKWNFSLRLPDVVFFLFFSRGKVAQEYFILETIHCLRINWKYN